MFYYLIKREEVLIVIAPEQISNTKPKVKIIKNNNAIVNPNVLISYNTKHNGYNKSISRSKIKKSIATI